MGNLYREDRRLDEAEKCLQDGKIVLERLLANEPADTNLQNSLAGLCCNFGLIYANQDRHADAVAAYDKAIALLTTLTRDHPGLPT